MNTTTTGAAAALQASGSKLAIGDALITAVMGYAMVFVGIVLLIIVVSIVSSIMKRNAAKPAPAGAAVGNIPAPDKGAPAVELVKTGPVAPGSAGELKLYDTDPKTAAMIMAIVADETGTPLNQLRFKSIREVK